MTGQSRLNILVVVFDSLAEADVLALSDKLPALSNLRRSSTVFTHAYSPSPQSGPARASLFTGLDMAAHGVWTDGVTLPAHETPFPERFAVCGYRTWLVGRRQLAGVSNWTSEHARAQEYDQFEWAHGPLHRSRQNAYLNWLKECAPDTYAGIFPSQPNPDDTVTGDEQYKAMAEIPDDLSFNTWVGARASAQISKQKHNQPFLGIAGFVVGSTLGGAPTDDRLGERLDERALRQADTALGQILSQINGQTIVIVTAARGTLRERHAKHDIPECAIKVPLLIHSDQTDPSVIHQAVSTLDFAPTLYDLAQIPAPQRTQGTALLNPKSTARGWALARLRKPGKAHQTALCTERWKLVMHHGDPDQGVLPCYSLYDLYTDPAEITSLSDLDHRAKDLEDMIDLMIDARVALEDRTEPRIAKF